MRTVPPSTPGTTQDPAGITVVRAESDSVSVVAGARPGELMFIFRIGPSHRTLTFDADAAPHLIACIEAAVAETRRHQEAPGPAKVAA